MNHNLKCLYFTKIPPPLPFLPLYNVRGIRLQDYSGSGKVGVSGVSGVSGMSGVLGVSQMRRQMTSLCTRC